MGLNGRRKNFCKHQNTETDIETDVNLQAFFTHCRERVRVVVSVWSDCVGAAVADKLTRGEQELLNYRNSQYRLLKYDMMDTVKEADYV